MAGEIRRISINEIVNYFENPRHAIAMNEKDTLKKLFDAVGNQYMLNLAEDIRSYGLLGNQQLVVVYSDVIHKYIVYEGNRRVAAIKLLENPRTSIFWISQHVIRQLKFQINQVIRFRKCCVM